ncbi:hypothetical protein ACS0TY_007427 [Phlomoides rotata]
MVEEIHGATSKSRHTIDARVRKDHWETPPLGTFKLNSDAEVYKDRIVAYDFVVLIAGAKSETAGGSSTLIEARALLHGFATSAECGQHIAHAESDLELFIRSINGNFEGKIYVMKSDEQVWFEEIPASCISYLWEDVRLLPIPRVE